MYNMYYADTQVKPNGIKYAPEGIFNPLVARNGGMIVNLFDFVPGCVHRCIRIWNINEGPFQVLEFI
jgi:hypothetical protein